MEPKHILSVDGQPVATFDAVDECAANFMANEYRKVSSDVTLERREPVSCLSCGLPFRASQYVVCVDCR